MVKLIGCVGDYSPSLLFHFLQHHLELGVDQLFVILHTEDREGPTAEETLDVMRQFQMHPERIWVGEFTTFQKHRLMSQVVEEKVEPTDWLIPADLDEFRFFPEPLKTFFEHCDVDGHAYITGQLMDRIAEDGSLKDVSRSESLDEQFPLGCRITRTLALAVPWKIVALRGYLRFNMGHHFLASPFRSSAWWSEYPRVLNVHHFRWESTLRTRLEKRAKSFTKRGIAWSAESERILDFLSVNGERIEPSDSLVKAFRV